LTAKNETEDIIKGFEVGGVDYITKPFNPKELVARIKNHLELKTLRDRLEERVRQETSLRLEQQEALIKSSKMAALGEMISVIAHQWKQPLTVLSILKEDIREIETEDTETLSYVVSMLTKQINYMSTTIDDFRNFFNPKKIKSPFFISSAVNGVFDLVLRNFKSRNIFIESRNSNSVDIEINGYQAELRQVILNIINNAKDAIIERQSIDKSFMGKIDVDIFNRDRLLRIVVSDNGGGIPDDLIEKIFDSHFTTKTEDKGTGIGLYIARLIIESSFNGRIYAQNSINGAEFIIEIPIEQ
jgi:C4-dicarboxylate-specific signal transduction histidine kinase